MTLAYVVIGLSFVLFGGSAVWALAWAFRKGQLENFQRGASSIFDDDEPPGRFTDSFPGEGGPPAGRDGTEAP